jgi:hypothetical protein
MADEGVEGPGTEAPLSEPSEAHPINATQEEQWAGMGEVAGETGVVAVGGGDQLEGDEEEEFYDEAQEMALIREFGGHPLMQRVQDTLLSQLKQTLQRLQGEHKDVQEDLRRTGDKRDTVGVELYGQQQQLARLQLTLESMHDGFSKAGSDRASLEVSGWPHTEPPR